MVWTFNLEGGSNKHLQNFGGNLLKAATWKTEEKAEMELRKMSC
jgi:hypothetical protein